MNRFVIALLWFLLLGVGIIGFSVVRVEEERLGALVQQAKASEKMAQDQSAGTVAQRESLRAQLDKAITIIGAGKHGSAQKAVPASVHFRKAQGAKGYVVQILNMSSDSLPFRITVTPPHSHPYQYPGVLDAGKGIEFHAIDDHDLTASDKITVESPGFISVAPTLE